MLRLNLSSTTQSAQRRSQLRASNAALQSELSAALASGRVQAQARRVYRLQPADPSTIGYDQPRQRSLMARSREKQANRRIRLLLVIFVLAFAALLARSAWIQGVQASRYASIAHNQQETTIKIPAGRGTIFDETASNSRSARR